MKQKSLGVKARKRIGSVVYHCFMVLLSLTMIYPFVWSVLSSFKTSEQLYGGSPLDLLPKPATLYNYERLFQVLPFGKFVVNLCRMLPKSTVRRWNAITNLVIDKVYCYGIENR